MELLGDAVYKGTIQQSARRITVNMNGYSIASVFLFLNGNHRIFKNGTIVGNFGLWNSSTADVRLSALEDAEYAVNGGVSVPNGTMTIRGAKVGLKGTLAADSKFDISEPKKRLN